MFVSFLWSTDSWGPLAGVGMTALTITYQIRRRLKRGKVLELLNSMARTYQLFETPSFSWEILWRSMDEARRLGAVWLGELWKLVELRRSKLTAAL